MITAAASAATWRGRARAARPEGDRHGQDHRERLDRDLEWRERRVQRPDREDVGARELEADRVIPHLLQSRPGGRNSAIEAPTAITNPASTLRTVVWSASPGRRRRAEAGWRGRTSRPHLSPTSTPRLIGLVQREHDKDDDQRHQSVVGALLHPEQAERARRPQPRQQEAEATAFPARLAASSRARSARRSSAGRR